MPDSEHIFNQHPGDQGLIALTGEPTIKPINPKGAAKQVQYRVQGAPAIPPGTGFRQVLWGQLGGLLLNGGATVGADGIVNCSVYVNGDAWRRLGGDLPAGSRPAVGGMVSCRVVGVGELIVPIEFRLEPDAIPWD